MDTLTLQPRMDGIPREAFAALLSRQILRYTRFQSSSVRTETAEQIARSILYALSALSAEGARMLPRGSGRGLFPRPRLSAAADSTLPFSIRGSPG